MNAPTLSRVGGSTGDLFLLGYCHFLLAAMAGYSANVLLAVWSARSLTTGWTDNGPSPGQLDGILGTVRFMRSDEASDESELLL
jgi:hypothetical protein